MANDNASADNDKKQNGEDLEQVKIMAALAYFGILFFLPLVTNPNSQFGKFHANQGLMLLIFGFAGTTIGTIIPLIGWFLILPVVSIASLVFFVMGIINALNKDMKRLPLIGNFDLIK
ncbi:MAG: hypothetical protein U5K77_03560 [Candidatus Saccharibacteria bacterium]|nr:hypothetical protein [Candidatus Saccharibacteria bacterium]